MGLFRNAERSASAEASEKTRLLVINSDCLEPLKKRNSKIAAKLFLNLANRLQLSLQETTERLLTQKDYDLTNLEAKLKANENIDQTEISITAQKFWENLGKNWHSKIKSFSETHHILSGKRVTNIKGTKGNFLFITSGEVEIVSTASLKSETFTVGYCWTRKDFDLIGEFSLCTGNSESAARAIARKDSTLLHFTKDGLMSLTQQEPRIAAQFLEDLVCILSDQLAIADKRLQDH